MKRFCVTGSDITHQTPFVWRPHPEEVELRQGSHCTGGGKNQKERKKKKANEEKLQPSAGIFDKSTNGAPVDRGLESSRKEDGVVGTGKQHYPPCSCSIFG